MKLRIILCAIAALLIFAAPASAARKVLFHDAPAVCGVNADPLLGFGQDPFGHNHCAFGSTAFGPELTLRKALDSPTSAVLKSNHSSVWVPSMRAADGTIVKPLSLSYYYQLSDTQPMLEDVVNGIRFVGGKSSNERASSAAGIWYCYSTVTSRVQTSGVRYIPSSCPAESNRLIVQLTMGDCWNGTDYGPGMGGVGGPADGKSHVITDNGSANNGTAWQEVCRDPDRLYIPTLLTEVRFPVTAAGGRLDSDHDFADPGSSWHMDYFFAWGRNSAGEFAFPRIVEKCLNIDANIGGIGTQVSCKERSDGTVWTNYGTPVRVTD